MLPLLTASTSGPPPAAVTMPDWLPGGLAGLLLVGFVLYLPIALLLRLPEYWLMQRLSERNPRLLPFFGLHAGAAAVSALFAPALCYLMGGQILVALGLSETSDSGVAVLRVSWWLISFALPLQLHYTANSVLCRIGAEGRISPKWLPWLWAGNTALAVSLAWLPLWGG